MPYQYDIKSSTGFIRVEVFGTRKPEHAGNDALGVWAEIAGKADSIGQPKVLYLSHVSGAIPVMEAYDVVDQFVDNNWNELKIAYVDLADCKVDDLRMLKAICFQHEIVFEFFDNESAAIDWLANLDE